MTITRDVVDRFNGKYPFPDTKRWREICEIEPRISALAEEAKAYHKEKEPPFCANSIWYGGLKEKMSALVGWKASNPELQNKEDYDLVYDTIYGYLPDCDHDGECCWGIATPGPWEVFWAEDYGDKDAPGHWVVCQKNPPNMQVGRVWSDEDARLIVAVPKLLEALEMFVNLANNIEEYGAMNSESDWRKVKYVRDVALDAIRKARGIE